ncbi:MAG TPA: acylphosphatase [Acidobacteriota bacterium]|jgi:acylphosphatase
MTIGRKHYWLSGMVQGVGFRYFAFRLARELELKGWVRNLSDGRVEIDIQGEESQLDQFLLEIKSGPQLAVVRDIAVETRQPDDNCIDFRIED